MSIQCRKRKGLTFGCQTATPFANVEPVAAAVVAGRRFVVAAAAAEVAVAQFVAVVAVAATAEQSSRSC